MADAPASVAGRILGEHLVAGELRRGAEISIRIDQTLTQDATGTLAYLQFEALGLPAVRNELALSYVDHNTLQTGFENADDHRFLRSAAAKYGVRFSRPGNGISHQVHLERFAAPGKTLLGSDSHTPTAGAMGMIAIGAGGLDVAMAMAGQPFSLAMPAIVRVRLTGAFGPWVSAKDVILELLRKLSVRGGVGRIFEYAGEGLSRLSIPERATIANMGAELGATTSIFPSDEQTRRYLAAQGREGDWHAIAADRDDPYDGELEVALDQLEPLVALPNSPDKVVPVREAAGTPIQQVIIGSCTNSSYRDLFIAAKVLEGKTVHPDVSLVIAPGSRQAFLMAEFAGLIETFIRAGARVIESACGPCIGMGQAPASGAASLRSFNRNFVGRSGTQDAQVYLASPEICAVAALTGQISDPRELGMHYPEVPQIPERYDVDDRLILDGPAEAVDGPAEAMPIMRGPNIAPLPTFPRLADSLQGPVLLRLGDDVSTDTIMPAGSKILPLRSNIPALSVYAFAQVDPTFAARAKQQHQGFVVAGSNYGQGSSREHAAIVLRYLGVVAVVARSFARIHAANLVNFGILPLLFADDGDFRTIGDSDVLRIDAIDGALARGARELPLENLTQGRTIQVRHELTDRQIEIVRAGGLLNHVRGLIAHPAA